MRRSFVISSLSRFPSFSKQLRPINNLARVNQIYYYGIKNYTEKVQEYELSQTKYTPDTVPHPLEFFDSDPFPHLREALSTPPVRKVDPKVAELVDQVANFNLVELVQLNHLLCKGLGISSDILEVIAGALSAPRGGAAGAAEAAESAPAPKVEKVVETGFRKLSIRDVPKGVKEKFEIMKIMRAENPALSLADVCLFIEIYNYNNLIYSKFLEFYNL